MTNWYTELKEAFASNNEDFAKMETTLTESELQEDIPKNRIGEPFTAWGEKYVYFPTEYDGTIGVGSAPRNVCEEVTYHQGES